MAERAAATAGTTPPPVLELRGVVRDFGTRVLTRVLHGIDLRLERAEFAALIGPSGSGKSTLLTILGLLERLSDGDYELDGRSVRALDDDELTAMRRRTLGFVFQFHHLLPAFTALENVTLPALARDGHVSAALRERARALLDGVGLGAAMQR